MFSGFKKMIKNFNLVGRLKATAIHLICSLLIFIFVIWIMLTYWYPMPHFQINGGWQGTKIMVLVDLIIGPALTFFIYNTRKPLKELKIDLSIIIILQSILLLYGLTQVYSQRPFVQVISHRGYIATALKKDLIYPKTTNPSSLIKAFNTQDTTPPIVYSVYKNYLKKKPLFENLFNYSEHDPESKGDLSPELAVSRYSPINSPQVFADIKNAEKQSIKKLSTNKENVLAIDKYKEKYGEQFYFFRLIGEYGEAIIVLDQHIKPVDYFNIKMFD